MDSENSRDYDDLMATAEEISTRAYAPYSGTGNGATVLAADGRTFSGCSVELASYGGTICAEASAVSRAVAEGCRKFSAISLFPRRWPCGTCRQMLAEFGTEIMVVTSGDGNSLQSVRLAQLLPKNFGPDDLH